jgi:hypothetical protein
MTRAPPAKKDDNNPECALHPERRLQTRPCGLEEASSDTLPIAISDQIQPISTFADMVPLEEKPTSRSSNAVAIAASGTASKR